MNKRAMEWPTFLISTIFSMFLFFIGVFMIFNVAQANKIDFERHTELLDYGLLASRVLNSADCLAWEERTPQGYLVHAGILDADKFNIGRMNNCISGKDYYVGIFTWPLANAPTPTVGKSIRFDIPSSVLYVGTNIILDKKYYDWFAIKLYKNEKFYDGIALVAIK